jgi:hypothetical protein
MEHIKAQKNEKIDMLQDLFPPLIFLMEYRQTLAVPYPCSSTVEKLAYLIILDYRRGIFVSLPKFQFTLFSRA